MSQLCLVARVGLTIDCYKSSSLWFDHKSMAGKYSIFSLPASLRKKNDFAVRNRNVLSSFKCFSCRNQPNRG